MEASCRRWMSLHKHRSPRNNVSRRTWPQLAEATGWTREFFVPRPLSKKIDGSSSPRPFSGKYSSDTFNTHTCYQAPRNYCISQRGDLYVIFALPLSVPPEFESLFRWRVTRKRQYNRIPQDSRNCCTTSAACGITTSTMYANSNTFQGGCQCTNASSGGHSKDRLPDAAVALGDKGRRSDDAWKKAAAAVRAAATLHLPLYGRVSKKSLQLISLIKTSQPDHQ